MLASRTGRWSMGTALLCVVLLVASWFLLIAPRRADATDIRSQAAAADSQAASLQVKIAQLKAEAAGLSARKQELAAIQTQLTPKADIPDLVRRLQDLAVEAGVSLDSVTPGAPSVVGNGPGGTTAGGTTTGGTTAAGAGTLVSIPVAIAVTGDYFEDSLFVKNLQLKAGRAYLVTGLTGTPAQDQAAAPTPSATPTAAPSAAASTTPAPSVTPTAGTGATGTTGSTTTDTSQSLDRMSLTLTGSVFVLLDGTVTLDDVADDVKAAKKNGTTASVAPGLPPTPASTTAGQAN